MNCDSTDHWWEQEAMKEQESAERCELDGLNTLPSQAASWEESCDNCTHQEGRHYCLYLGKAMKNMDTLTCSAWEQSQK